MSEHELQEQIDLLNAGARSIEALQDIGYRCVKCCRTVDGKVARTPRQCRYCIDAAIAKAEGV